MGEISGWEALVLLTLILVIVGPDKLPELAGQLGGWLRRAREFARETSATLRAEVGDEFDGIDLESLDPRQYDPRRIVREALREPPPPAAPARPQPGAPGASPFDDEAT